MSDVRDCDDDRCWPAWYGDNPWPKCHLCREPVYNDGSAWRHIVRPEPMGFRP